MSTTRERLFAEKTKECEIPEYGKFHVRIIDGEQMAAHHDRIRAYNKPDDPTQDIDIYAGLVCVAVCNQEKKREFCDDQISEVRKLPHPVLLGLFEHARAFNFPPDEEVKKNSPMTPDSTSS